MSRESSKRSASAIGIEGGLHSQAKGAIKASVRVLGYENVRQDQFDVVLKFLEGNDMFVSLPTGGGKSLCYACLLLVCD